MRGTGVKAGLYCLVVGLALGLCSMGVKYAQAQGAAPPVTVVQPPVEEAQQEIEGKVKEINIQAGTIVVSYVEVDDAGKETQKTASFQIGKKTNISIDNDKAALKDLRVGDEMLVSFTQDEKGGRTAVEVVVTRQKDQDGVLKAIDPKGQKLMLEVTNIDENGKETKVQQAFVLPEGVPVTIDGNEAALKDARQGDQVWVTYLEDTPGKRVVKAIEVTREFTVFGKVKKLDVTAKSLVVTVVSENAEGKETRTDETLQLGKDVTVIINNEEAKLGQLKVGNQVWVTYSQEPNGPRIVTQIDVEKGE